KSELITCPSDAICQPIRLQAFLQGARASSGKVAVLLLVPAVGARPPQNLWAESSSVAWKDRASTPLGSPVNLPRRCAQSKKPAAGKLPRALLSTSAAMNGRP